MREICTSGSTRGEGVVRTGICFSVCLWNKDTLTPELRKLAEKWVIRRESGDPLTESWQHQHVGAAQWAYT